MNQAILSVIDQSKDIIVEHRLVPSEQSNEALLTACSEYVPNWDKHSDIDKEIIQDDGRYETGHYVMCVIHLDANGRYEQ